MANLYSDAEWSSLQSVLMRAQRAIQRAKTLSERFADNEAAVEEALSQVPGLIQGQGTAAPNPAAPASTVEVHEAMQGPSSPSIPHDVQPGVSVLRPVALAHDESGTNSTTSTSSTMPTSAASTSQETSPRGGFRTSPRASSLLLPAIKAASQRLRERAALLANHGETQQLDSHHTTSQQQDLDPLQPPSQTSTSSLPPALPQTQLSTAPLTNLTNPLLLVARRLAELQQQQSNTLSQLLGLRLEQLRLRQQQLSALQELLRAEAATVEGTPLQMSAVHQALSLLAQSLEDMEVAAAAITASNAQHTTGADIAVVAATVSCADARAEDISRMARQLLGVLREYPRRSVITAEPGAQHHTRAVVRGATDWELSSLPTMTCGPSHPMVNEPCAICLAPFTPGDALKSMQCAHAFHTACIDQWLRIKAACPLCKTTLPGAEVHVAVADHARVGVAVRVDAAADVHAGGGGAADVSDPFSSLQQAVMNSMRAVNGAMSEVSEGPLAQSGGVLNDPLLGLGVGVSTAHVQRQPYTYWESAMGDVEGMSGQGGHVAAGGEDGVLMSAGLEDSTGGGEWAARSGRRVREEEVAAVGELVAVMEAGARMGAQGGDAGGWTQGRGGDEEGSGGR